MFAFAIQVLAGVACAIDFVAVGDLKGMSATEFLPSSLQILSYNISNILVFRRMGWYHHLVLTTI